jgi:hypothetical protein
LLQELHRRNHEILDLAQKLLNIQNIISSDCMDKAISKDAMKMLEDMIAHAKYRHIQPRVYGFGSLITDPNNIKVFNALVGDGYLTQSRTAPSMYVLTDKAIDAFRGP